MDQPPDLATAIIGVEIDAAPLGHGSAIDVSTRHRTATLGMRVLSNRFQHALGAATFVVMRALPIIPAEICAARRAFGEKIDFLPGILTDISDIEITS